MSGLSESDVAAIASAVRILTEAGFEVTKTNHTKRGDSGVEFKLECSASTHATWFQPQLEAVKTAAIGAPEYGIDGEPIPEGGQPSKVSDRNE